jgi:hypothetical protein
MDRGLVGRMVRASIVSMLVLSAAACGGKTVSNTPADGGDAAIEVAVDRPVVPDATGADELSDTASADMLAPGDGALAATCEGAAAVNVCGCGCCGQPQSTVCYFPALGDSAGAIPDPRPSNCATVGCSAGVRHVCCADPGAPPSIGDAGNDGYCARDPATNLPRIQVTRTEGTTCTTITLRGPTSVDASTAQPIPGWMFESGTRGPCVADGSAARDTAIGALGHVAFRPSPAPGHIDAHLSVFFDATSGVADTVRFDFGDLPLSLSNCAP